MDQALATEFLRLVRYVMVGVINTAFGYGVFAGLVLLSVQPQIALLTATLLGIGFNYFSTRVLVFRTKATARSALLFIAVYGAGYIANAALLYLLTDRARISALIGQLICIPVIVVVNYVLMRTLVFSGTSRAV